MNTRTLFTSFSPPPFSLTVHHKIHQRITPQHHQQQSNPTFQRSFVHTIPHRVTNRHSQPQRHKRHQCQPHLDKKNINNQNLSKSELHKIFFSNLHKIGYRYFDKKKPSKSDKKIIKVFQKRFRQNKVNGQIDQECLQISRYLASSLKY